MGKDHRKGNHRNHKGKGKGNNKGKSHKNNNHGQYGFPKGKGFGKPGKNQQNQDSQKFDVKKLYKGTFLQDPWAVLYKKTDGAKKLAAHLDPEKTTRKQIIQGEIPSGAVPKSPDVDTARIQILR